MPGADPADSILLSMTVNSILGRSKEERIVSKRHISDLEISRNFRSFSKIWDLTCKREWHQWSLYLNITEIWSFRQTFFWFSIPNHCLYTHKWTTGTTFSAQGPYTREHQLPFAMNKDPSVSRRQLKNGSSSATTSKKQIVDHGKTLMSVHSRLHDLTEGILLSKHGRWIILCPRRLVLEDCKYFTICVTPPSLLQKNTKSILQQRSTIFISYIIYTDMLQMSNTEPRIVGKTICCKRTLFCDAKGQCVGSPCWSAKIRIVLQAILCVAAPPIIQDHSGAAYIHLCSYSDHHGHDLIRIRNDHVVYTKV